jgi:hypothetical protein
LKFADKPSPVATAPATSGDDSDTPKQDFLGFNPRQPMRLYEVETVTVSAGRSGPRVRDKVKVPGLPEPEIDEFMHTGRLVEAELTGDDGFHIEPAFKASIQDIDNPNEPAVWKWFVTPQKPETHKLVLSICFHSMVNGIDARRCDPSQEKQIEVVVTGLVPRVKYWATEYGWAGALVPAGTVGILGTFATWVWARFKKRKKPIGFE